MTKTPIPIEGKKEGFDGFINQPNNQRIFFSAPFGMGKTYFLKEFFEAKKDRYKVFHLYPVKYQVNNDAEVMELIGADLLIRLMKEEPNIVNDLLKDEDIRPKIKYACNAVLKNLPFLTGIGVLAGIDVPSAIEAVKKLRENEKLKEVEDALANVKNSFFEDIVREVLKKAKESDKKEGNKKENDKKESVLIIDDLDRLEPKHIFKILNAFSPLLDEEENKFGFDKVIFVGDIDNLKKIFHHLYGEGTDFDGYIDKFFSTTPYRYDIKKELRGVIKQIIMAGYAYDKEYDISQIMKENGSVAFMLFFILMHAFKTKEINLRNIYMPQKAPFLISTLENQLAKISVKMLLQLFQNNKEKLLDIIKAIKEDITSTTMLLYSERDIHNLKYLRYEMLLEICATRKDPSGPYPFSSEGEEQGYEQRLEQYREGLSHQEENNRLEVAQSFLSILHEYIEQDIQLCSQ